MKSYLDLVSISTKLHKKQNRMSIFCIVLAVLLVTVIFGMADMFIRSQIMQSERENGKWHAAIREITDREAELISMRPEIESAARYGMLNYRGDQGYTLSGKNVIICGSDENWLKDMTVDLIVEGAFPQKDSEAVISESAGERLGIRIGSQLTVDAPDGRKLLYTVTGFFKNVSKTMSEDSYAVFVTTEAFRKIYPAETGDSLADYNSLLYVRFSGQSNIQDVITDIKEQFGLIDRQVSENTMLLGLIGQSRDSFMMQIYGTAGILFLLVLLAGVLMITSSLNSNIVQRTEFFGMIRCIGATPKQIMKLVQREALSWCRFAIPLGIILGMVIIGILCAVLRRLSPEYFSDMPVLAVSLPSIFTGIFIGLLTVIVASRSPAKRASRVTPLTAASGNASNLLPVRNAANTALFKVDTSLGIHHAKADRKNFILMLGSFSLSIVLFLAFSVTIDFMKHSLTPLRPWTADISIISPDQTASVEYSLPEKLRENPAVKKVYGRMFAYNIPASADGREMKIDLISYEQHQFDWAEKYRIEGSLDQARQEELTGVVVYEPQNNLKTGDTIRVNTGGRSQDIRITGVLSECPFDNAADVGTIICSEDTFRQVTGGDDYTIVDLQLSHGATEADVNSIYRLAGDGYIFADERAGNSSVKGSYYSFGIFIYGFLIVIALITIFNIINSVAMSFAARIRQYGVLRAIGLSNRQLIKMIAAEACTYAVMGSICGCLVGIPVNKFLYTKLVTFRWGVHWEVPVIEAGVILAVMVFSTFLAVKGPVKRIRDMSIVDTISSQ